MSSRALRKAQREREEQERLQKLEALDDGGESEEEVSVNPAKKSAFAMLEEDEGEDEDDDAGTEQTEVPVDGDQPEEAAVDATPNTPSKKKKKKKKGKKGGCTPNGNDTGNDDEELDEIDKALKQLRMGGNASVSGSTVAGVNAQTDETSKLLAVDSSHLHAQNEMRRLFGRAALEQQDDEERPQQGNVGGNRRQQRRVQQVGLAQALRGNQQGGRQGALAAMALKRNIFVQGKEEWPNATGGGLGMEVEEKRADGRILYRYIRNSGYQDVQKQFDIAVESMDPNRLIILLQQNPYHIATLLQVSEIAKQERNHSVSGDLLERALFSFGRAVHSTFTKNLAEGKARLDFRRPQNREFWLASWRYMQNLSMRATWRTVYEWAKLLLQLSPEDDPYAIWLVLDQYALRARQDLDFLNISRSPLVKNHTENMPNVELSQGLAEWRAGNKGKGQQALFKAVGRFPWVVARLMQELNLDPPPAVWGKEPRTDNERLQSEAYATRAKDLWATPETSTLLMEVASALPPDVQPAKPNVDDVTENVARHVLLSDASTLIGLIPRHFTEQLQSSSDPLPPPDTYEPTTNSSPASRQPIQLTEQDIDDMQTEFATLTSWLDHHIPAGVDSGMTEEQIAPIMRDHGISREDLLPRLQRFAELHQVLGFAGRMPGSGQPGHVPGGFDDEDDDDDDEANMRARVEDADDEGD